MTAKPYTAEELAELRARAGNAWHTLEGMPARMLATISALETERDELRLRLAKAEEALEVERAGAMHAQLEADALREAARTLVDVLATAGGGRQCSDCYALAMVGDSLPRGGSVFHCDKHARAPAEQWEDDPQESHPTKAAPALRRLRALIEVKP